MLLAGSYFGGSEIIGKFSSEEHEVNNQVIDSVLPLLAVAAILSLPSAIISRSPRGRRIILTGMALALTVAACAGAGVCPAP